MEHNFTFTSASEISLIRALINSIHWNENKYNAMRSIVDFAPELPNFDDYDVNVSNLLDRLAEALTKAEEDEKPKYEHRYTIFNRDGVECHEDDDLENTFGVYAEYYQNDYASNHDVDEGDYEIYDNKEEETVTSDIPCFDVEYEWSVDLDVSLDGRRVYDYEIPDWVMESIGSDIGGGDTAGSACDTIGDIEWSDIADWESDHEEEQNNETAEVSTDAVSNSTEETATEPDNTWHVY